MPRRIAIVGGGISGLGAAWALHHHPDHYEITYIMHNQQPWANRSDKPCLVTYNAISPIDERKVIKKQRFQHIVHDVRHVALLVNLFRFKLAH